MIRPFALLLTLAGIFSASEADAQFFSRRARVAPVASYPSSPAPASYGTTTYSSYYSGPGATSSTPTRSYSYSYYTLSPLPARTYVGYGMDEFPFHGSPYGHPYDPWTWGMMSGSYGNGLSRYYDPPVK